MCCGLFSWLVYYIVSWIHSQRFKNVVTNYHIWYVTFLTKSTSCTWTKIARFINPYWSYFIMTNFRMGHAVKIILEPAIHINFKTRITKAKSKAFVFHQTFSLKNPIMFGFLKLTYLLLKIDVG